MTTNSLDTLSGMTGLTKADMQGILANVRANLARLDTCAVHRFEAIEPDRVMSRYRCTHCKGEVDSHAAHWYARGMAHANGRAK
jgi:hypothetical protein